MHPKSFILIFPHVSTIPTYMRYSFADLSEFVCAISNFKNKFPFCVPGSCMERLEVVSIFHAKRVILRSSVYSVTIAREKGGNRDAQPQTANRKSLQITKQKIKFIPFSTILSLSMANRIHGCPPYQHFPRNLLFDNIK